VLNDTLFIEFTLRLPRPAAGVVSDLAARGVLAGVPASRLFAGDAGVDHLLIVAATETNTEADLAAYEAALREVLS
jgi:glycine dehydrogenase subunit 1